VTWQDRAPCQTKAEAARPFLPPGNRMSDEKPATLHERILTEVRENILRGEWRPGHRIPFETDMAAEYGVSRMTVNKVLTQLTREGYLERRRKVGTFVAKPRVQSAVMEIANIGEEIRERGESYGFETITHEVRAATSGELAALGLASGALRGVGLEYVHRADGEPFCHEARVISLAAVPQAESADFTAEQAGTWLLRQVPWSAAEHTIRAVTPPPRVLKLLALAAGTACLEIERRTEFEGRPITFARLTYPGTKHQLVAQFAPHASAGATA
jgi:GntR family histidine utilization transcriptional repressor